MSSTLENATLETILGLPTTPSQLTEHEMQILQEQVLPYFLEERKKGKNDGIISEQLVCLEREKFMELFSITQEAEERKISSLVYSIMNLWGIIHYKE